MHDETPKQWPLENKRCLLPPTSGGHKDPPATVDSYLKPEISQQGKAVDKDLAKIQTFVLDSLAPLSHLMELDAQGHKINHSEAIGAAQTAIELIGNANAKISHLRRTKVISQLNKSLLPLVEEDSNFGEVAPSLFGPEFARKSKEHVEQVKAMRSVGGTKDSRQQFFRSGPPNSRGGYYRRPGRGGSQNFQKGNRQQQQQRSQWTK